MEENPYKVPKQRGTRLSRFKLKHVPLLIAFAIGALVLLKLTILFIELAVALIQEGVPKIPASP